jgi:hypothetical protein
MSTEALPIPTNGNPDSIAQIFVEKWKNWVAFIQDKGPDSAKAFIRALQFLPETACILQFLHRVSQTSEDFQLACKDVSLEWGMIQMQLVNKETVDVKTVAKPKLEKFLKISIEEVKKNPLLTKEGEKEAEDFLVWGKHNFVHDPEILYRTARYLYYFILCTLPASKEVEPSVKVKSVYSSNNKTH